MSEEPKGGATPAGPLTGGATPAGPLTGGATPAGPLTGGATPAGPLLEVSDLVKHFPLTRGVVLQRRIAAVRAVDGISFELAPGETLGLVGETGCGKSTVARLIVRLLEPTAGSIRLEGEEIAAAEGERLKAIRRQVQMVFQDPYSSLNPRKSAGSIIGEPFAIHGLEPGAERRRRAVQELMERVGLNPEHYNRYPHEFSGGQRQRIGVARALATAPRLIVADEPVSALDVSIQGQILNLLRELRRELGMAMIFISHDLSVVRHMCDRIAVMYLGKIVELAPSAELFSHPRHPYTGALLSAIPVPDPSLPQREPALEGAEVPSATDPPAACRFHTRCPKCEALCTIEEPVLEPKNEPAHPGEGAAACHFPLTAAEAAERLPGGGP